MYAGFCTVYEMFSGMKKQISSEQTDSNIKEVMGLLRETPAKLEGLSKGLSDRRLHEPLGSEERSFVEALAHLINCEAITSESIYLALMLNEPLKANIHAERDLGKLLRFDLLPFAELMAYFKIRRTILMRILEALTEKEWSRVMREEKSNEKNPYTGEHVDRHCMNSNIYRIWKTS